MVFYAVLQNGNSESQKHSYLNANATIVHSLSAFILNTLFLKRKDLEHLSSSVHHSHSPVKQGILQGLWNILVAFISLEIRRICSCFI